MTESTTPTIAPPADDKKLAKAKQLPPGIELAIVWYPKADGRLGGQGFHFPVDEKKAVGQDGAIQLDFILLDPGINFVVAEKWGKVEAHKPYALSLSLMKSKQALKVFVPDADIPTGCSADFSDVAVALTIVQACGAKQTEWLDLSRARDNRAPILQAIAAKLRAIREERAARKSEEFSLI